MAQAGLRESLERLDVDQDGDLDLDEITPLARPYLERIAKSRGLSMDRPYGLDKWQETARIYHALQNGVAGKRIQPGESAAIKGFRPDDEDAVVPEFGLAKIKYPYTREDLEETEETMDRYDRDRNGFLDVREAQRVRWTHRDPFEEDYDGDGRLSRMELTQRYARRRLLSGASDELVQKARRVGNGIRPASEEKKSSDRDQWWRKGGSNYWLTAAMMGRFDLNRNGTLQQNEAASLGIAPSLIDADRNGELTREELHHYMNDLQERSGNPANALPSWFYERDLNGDQQITLVEFSPELLDEELAEFTQLDVNADGLLTEKELIRSKSITGGDFKSAQATILPPRKTVISEIMVSESFLIADLNLQLSITHTHCAYLDAFLVGPDGQRIELFTAVGGNDDNFDNTTFDDQARELITKSRPPFRNSYLPEGLLKRQPGLSAFNGKSIQGKWQLIISGTRSERFGMLHSWSLQAQPQDSVPGEITAIPASLSSQE